MKITNKFNAPETIVSLASKQYYSKGRSQYSVTELLSPPRIRRLREEHNDRIEQDVSDMLWQLLGSALHVVMERGVTENHITEERIYTVVDGITISGQIDLQRQEDKGGVHIIDYKFTSAWAVMQDKREWEEQLNVYKWLVEREKKQLVTGLSICALVRDFNRHETREGYPASPIHMIDIPIWGAVETEAFVQSRLDIHRAAKASHALDDGLPKCTPEERWQTETTYAVKREGRKTAIRVFKSIEEADELAAKEKGYVEIRPGEPKRCTGNFCSVALWCDQYQNEIASGST